MQRWQETIRKALDAGASTARLGNWLGVGRFGTEPDEYEAARHGVGLCDRSYRGLFEITGPDRAAWLNNLTTNDVLKLQPGEGNYAFATNRQGQILFDMNVLVRSESIWVDVDRRAIQPAQSHFDKYVILEDVVVTDRSDDFLRVGLSGEKVAEFLGKLGCPQGGSMPFLQLGELSVNSRQTTCFRHDFCGVFGVELFLPVDEAVDAWKALAAQPHVVAVGLDAIDTLRTEAGIPWPFREILDNVLPAETAQLHRAVSFNKGCFLGQEIVARMQSRKSLSRRLVLMRLDGDRCPKEQARLFHDDQPVGAVTSACPSPAMKAPIALGYVRAKHISVGTRLRAECADSPIDCVVLPLPTSD